MKLTKKKILITGGSGFIASHLAHRFVEMGSEVIVLTKYDSIFDNIRLADIWNKIRVIEADIRNLDSLQQLKVIRPNIIYHFAAYNHVGDSFVHVNEAMDSNGKGTANVLETLDDYERFVYISTSEVYGLQDKIPFQELATPQPISPYSIGKYTGELYARMKYNITKLPIVILRPFNAFGPYQSTRAIIAEVVIKCLKNETILATSGVQTREFNYISNLVDGFLLAAENDNAIGKIINLGAGEEIAIRDLISKIHSLTKSSSDLRIGALQHRPTEIWRMVSDSALAESILGWKPRVYLHEGLQRTVEWYSDFLKVLEKNQFFPFYPK